MATKLFHLSSRLCVAVPRSRRICKTLLCQQFSQAHDGGSSVDVKMSKIYTKTGDKGTSVTIAGDRRPKDDAIFEALGSTDELSSTIGLAREFCSESAGEVNQQLEEIQCMLQDAGSCIATPKNLASSNQMSLTQFDGAAVDKLEGWIDQYTQQLPPLKNFILPSGGKASSCLHLARSICRRAERRLIPLVDSQQLDPIVAKYFNRLSDYLFTIARYSAQCEGREETIYKKIRPSKDK